MIQQCRYCQDFYRMDDETMSIETDEGWVSDICRQCHNEFNLAERELDSAWQNFYQQLCQEEHKTC